MTFQTRRSKAYGAAAILAAAVLCTAFFASGFLKPAAPQGTAPQGSSGPPSSALSGGLHRIELNGETIRVSVADTDAARERGLGGSAGLEPDEGMLFVFFDDAVRAFWMKDMRFSIDILWLAADGTILYIKEEASPESYPAVFAPQVAARYVLELPAGYARKHGVRVGDAAHLRR